MNIFTMQTERIGLRKFLPEDLDSFAAMNADPAVMRYFPNPMTVQACKSWMDRINDSIDSNGYSYWATELLATGELIGCVGLSQANFEVEFTPAIEIGWRLHQKFWGLGLASEAASRCLRFAFEEAGLVQVLSFTARINEPSWRVMRRIGMTEIGEFVHPKVGPDHPLQPHVLYRITAEEFLDS